MTNANRATRKGGKKAGNTQHGIAPKTSPVKLQGREVPQGTITVQVLLAGKVLGLSTLKFAQLEKLRTIADRHYEERVESAIEGAIELFLNGFDDKGVSKPGGAAFKLEEAIYNAIAVIDLLESKLSAIYRDQTVSPNSPGYNVLITQAECGRMNIAQDAKAALSKAFAETF